MLGLLRRMIPQSGQIHSRGSILKNVVVTLAAHLIKVGVVEERSHEGDGVG